MLDMRLLNFDSVSFINAITGGHVTCSLFIHSRNNGILLLLWNFRIKTKGMHLLVAEGKSLTPTLHRMPTFLSDQFGSPKCELFKSKLKRVQNGPWHILVHAKDAVLFQP